MSAKDTKGSVGQAGVPAAGRVRLAGVSPLGGGSLARCLSVGGRTARATAAAPLPRTRRQAVPPSRTLVTAPARAAGPSSSRPASCRRAKITVKSARCARVLRMAQAPLWTVILPGKIRHLSGGRDRADDSPGLFKLLPTLTTAY